MLNFSQEEKDHNHPCLVCLGHPCGGWGSGLQPCAESISYQGLVPGNPSNDSFVLSHSTWQESHSSPFNLQIAGGLHIPKHNVRRCGEICWIRPKVHLAQHSVVHVLIDATYVQTSSMYCMYPLHVLCSFQEAITRGHVCKVLLLLPSIPPHHLEFGHLQPLGVGVPSSHDG